MSWQIKCYVMLLAIAIAWNKRVKNNGNIDYYDINIVVNFVPHLMHVHTYHNIKQITKLMTNNKQQIN